MKKVALVCDWLTESGGAEEVIKKFHEIYPDAPIYTSQYRKGRTPWLKNADVRTGYLNFLPVRLRRFIVPLRQNYFKNLDLSPYDLVISITGCDAKFIRTTNTHVCYCHVPTQYYWGKYEEYLNNPGFGVLNILARPIFKKISPNLRKNDLEAAKNPDEFITISNFAKQEIKHFYKREAKVLNPPVNYDLFSQFVENYDTKKGKSQTKLSHNKTIKSKESQDEKSEQKFCTKLKNVENLSALAEVITKYPDGFYLNFSRQVNWKNLDLAIKACGELDLPLVLIGDGPENKELKRLAQKFNARSSHPNLITFLKPLEKSDLAMLSSLAKAFIFPSEEPFGIAPIEAMSAGCPVIALKKGGALDYIKEGKNGFFFTEPTVDSLKKSLEKFESQSVPLNRQKVSKTVEKYSTKNFDKNLKKVLKIKKTSNTNPDKKDMKTPPKKTEKLRNFLLLSFPAVLFLSYFPSLKIGETDTMYLELSLPLIYLGLFALLNLKTALEYFKAHLKTPLLIFPVFMTLSIFWSNSFLRGFLTAGVVWCIFITIVTLRKIPINPKIRKVTFISTAIVCLFCIVQSVLDTIGINRNVTLLCQGCTSEVFGFPHPNGFAIEPQFMGNLLLAPILLTFNSLLENKNKKSQIKYLLLSVLFIFTLFFTFSRGAIYSLFILILILLISNLKRPKNLLKLILIPVISFFLSLNLQGILAEFGPTNETGKSAVITVIDQLTLGKINLKNDQKSENLEEIADGEFSEPPIEEIIPIDPFVVLSPGEEQSTTLEVSTSPLFDGYIAESTERRLELASYALKIWSKNPTNTVLGTGLGSAGTVMLEDFPSQGIKKEIVQNQYLETLLELGLIGAILLILSFITFLKLEKITFEPYTFALIISYSVSLFFFSGLPNALHIYILPVIWYNLLYEQSKNSLSGI